MIKTSHLSQWVKDAIGFLLSARGKERSLFFFLLLIFLLPTQLGKHFWPSFSFIDGIRVDYLSPTLFLTDIVFFLLFISLLFSQQRKVFFRTFRSPLFLIAIGCFFISGIALSPTPLLGFYGILKFFEFFAFGVISASFLSYQNVRTRFYRILAVSVVFAAYLGVMQFLRHGSINGMFYYLGERFFTAETPGIANASVDGLLVLRPYSTFSHPNVFAGFLLISMIFMATGGFPLKAIKDRVVFFLSLVFGTIALLLTLSRVAIALWVFIVGGLYLWNVIKKKVGHRKRSVLFAFGFVVMCSILIIPFKDRYLRTSITEESVQQRIAQAIDAKNVFMNSPLFGVGLYQYLPVVSGIDSDGSFVKHEPVHNIFLLFLSETGLIGAMVALIFVKRTIGHVRGSSKENDSYVVAKPVVFFAIIFLGLFDHYFLTLQQGQFLLALGIGFLWTNNDIGSTIFKVTDGKKSSK